MAYTSDESGSSEVYVARFPSLEDRQAVSIGEGWAPVVVIALRQTSAPLGKRYVEEAGGAIDRLGIECP